MVCQEPFIDAAGHVRSPATHIAGGHIQQLIPGHSRLAGLLMLLREEPVEIHCSPDVASGPVTLGHGEDLREQYAIYTVTVPFLLD
jgi:hypothetical protein